MPFNGQQTTINVIGITSGGYRAKISRERSAPWCCTSHSAGAAGLIIFDRFSYRGERHERDESESAWRVAQVQASVPGPAGWFELRPANSERRHFARHRLFLRRRALQAGDAVLGSLKLSDTGASFNHVVSQQKEFARNRQVELFCCLQIDDQLELRRLLDG